jgi:hypothetical protein
MDVHLRNAGSGTLYTPVMNMIFNPGRYIDRTFLYCPAWIFVWNLKQGCGSGSQLNPDSIWSVDPDPYSESGSGSGRAKITYRSRKKIFEVLDIFSLESWRLLL